MDLSQPINARPRLAEIAMVEHGVGIGIFQRHCVARELAERSLYAYSPRSSRRAENVVYLVTPAEQKLPARVRVVIDAFWGMVK